MENIQEVRSLSKSQSDSKYILIFPAVNFQMIYIFLLGEGNTSTWGEVGDTIQSNGNSMNLETKESEVYLLHLSFNGCENTSKLFML